jgi:hypothetical protein
VGLVRRVPWLVVAWALGVIAAFAAYLTLAGTFGTDSDAGSNALQAWDMLHGNPLLHGWSLSDVSFYTTELPQYMLLEMVRGLNEGLAHVAAAMTYTLAVLLAMLLAKGGSTGREALLRMGIAAGIMLVPQQFTGVNVLMSSPDHIGTTVPVMVVWLILDRAPQRWYVPVIAGAMLAWADIGDNLVLIIGVAPLVLVCAFRVVQARVAERKPLASQWYYLALAGAALLAAGVAVLALHLIQAGGGFFVKSAPVHLVPASDLPRNAAITSEGLLLLGGAEFVGLRFGVSYLFALLHLAGVVLAAWGWWLAARRFRAGDLVNQVLLTAIVVNIVAYAVSTKPHVITGTREIAAVLPFSAALAGRLVAERLLAGRLVGERPPAGRVAGGRPPAGWLTAARVVPVLLVVLAGYLAGLAYELSKPQVPAQNQQLASWLEAHHLHSGLSGYWEANVATLTSGGQVQIRTVTPHGGRLHQPSYESKLAWYLPSHSYANFVVLFPGRRGFPGFTAAKAVRNTFGPPARTYHMHHYRILVWNRNVLTSLH